jgi:hypothetical protein
VSINKIDEVCIHDVCALCRLTGTNLTCELGSGARLPPATPRRGDVRLTSRVEA